MKKFTSLFLCVLLAGQTAAPVAAMSQDDEYEDAIEFLKDEDIAEGYVDGSFRAEQTINRAELTKIIMLATYDEDEMGGSHCFYDVQNQWFAQYVCAARVMGVVSGYTDGTFRPNNSVSVAEAAALIVRAYGESVSGGSTWYMPYIDQLEEWDAMPPTASGYYHDPLTRGEMAYIIWKIEEGDAGNDSDDDEENGELDISIRSDKDEAAIGETVTFTIELENESDDELEVDVLVSFDEDELGNVTADDDDADVDDEEIEWEEVEIDEDDEETLTFTATVKSGLSAGTDIEITVEADGEEDDLEITVKGTTTQQPQNPRYVHSSLGDPILYWNAVALQANADDHTGYYGAGEQVGPGSSTRSLAIVHAAMYDAVNSIDRGHQPYIALVQIQPGEKVSVDSAVAAAAHKTLTAMHPNQRMAFDIAYQAHLLKIPDGPDELAGIRVGEAAAQQVLSARANDGATTPDEYTAGNEPGRHRKDPMNPGQPFMGSAWGKVKPFVIAATWQFRASPPPALTSKEYADAFNEVKQYGGDGVTTPTLRTQEQTDIGLYWAYDGVKNIGTPPRLYNQMARVIAQQKGNDVVENARLFALINLALGDAGMAAWESKYHYNVWRPVIGIREADAGTGPTGLGDNNPLTAGDASWTPYGAPMSNMTATNFTPPFPAYPSGHATFGTAAFRIIERFYGTNNIAFTFTSDELNGVTTDNKGIVRKLAPRSFSNLNQAIRENADSRVYLGVHWRFDQDAGVEMGDKIADYVFSNALRPVR